LANDPKISPCISVGVRESRPLLTETRVPLPVVALKPASHGRRWSRRSGRRGCLQAELLLRLADAAQEFLAELGVGAE